MATQEAMVNWAKNNLYRWIDMDGMYGAQCVDLTMAYSQYFGNYRMFGNAIDYLKNPLPKGWRRYLKGQSTIAPGDIAIWQWGSWDIYGHVGIVIKVQGNIITSVEQNVDGTPSRGGTAKLMTRDLLDRATTTKMPGNEQMKLDNSKLMLLLSTFEINLASKVM